MARVRRRDRAATASCSAGGTGGTLAPPDPLLYVPEVSPTDARRTDQTFVIESLWARILILLWTTARY